MRVGYYRDKWPSNGLFMRCLSRSTCRRREIAQLQALTHYAYFEESRTYHMLIHWGWPSCRSVSNVMCVHTGEFH